MGYQLGIDLGTTSTTAAVRHQTLVRGLPLSRQDFVAPTVVAVDENGAVIVGRNTDLGPDHVSRDVKRHLGGREPIELAGTPHSPQWVVAQLVEWVVEQATRHEGDRPDEVIISHPANWRQTKIELLRDATALAGINPSNTRLISDPQAAALALTASLEASEGEVLVAYDLGGGSFDASVLQRSGAGFEVLGPPEGVDRLGGVDFDAALFRYATEASRPPNGVLNWNNLATREAAGRLRRACTEAKEALTTDDDAVLHVELWPDRTDVRITRAQFESMIRPMILETVGALRRALRGANVERADVSRVLLIGRSSRVPLVAQLVHDLIDRPVILDEGLDFLVAAGTAYAGTPTAEGHEARPKVRLPAPLPDTEPAAIPAAEPAKALAGQAVGAPGAGVGPSSPSPHLHFGSGATAPSPPDQPVATNGGSGSSPNGGPNHGSTSTVANGTTGTPANGNRRAGPSGNGNDHRAGHAARPSQPTPANTPTAMTPAPAVDRKTSGSRRIWLERIALVVVGILAAIGGAIAVRGVLADDTPDPAPGSSEQNDQPEQP